MFLQSHGEKSVINATFRVPLINAFPRASNCCLVLKVTYSSCKAELQKALRYKGCITHVTSERKGKENNRIRIIVIIVIIRLWLVVWKL
jgi:hypothetical protein